MSNKVEDRILTDGRRSILIDKDKHEAMMTYAKKNNIPLVRLIWNLFDTYKDGNIQSK